MKSKKVSSNPAQPTKRWRWVDASSRKGLPENYRPTSQKQRRRWVVTLVAGWFLLSVGFVSGDLIVDDPGLNLVMIGLAVAIVMGGVIALVSGIVNLTQDKSIMQITQSPLQNLDERQKQVRFRASEVAYNIVVCVVIIILLSIRLSPEGFQIVLGKSITDNLLFPILGAFFLKSLIVAWLEPDPIPEELEISEISGEVA